ncbi:MAG TPA: hypothetical protein VMC79_14595, partial [Rectinemataceae bacterium]|nr:hypothetical protein [Rectinemataceae bacterium]
MSEAHFQTLLAGNDAAPIVALDERQLDQAGDWGPASYYYLARWIESRSSGKGSGAARIAATDAGSASSADSAAPSLDAASERVRLLLRKAFDSNGGIVRRESGAALAQRLLGDGAAGVPDAWPQLASFDEVFHASLGADWTVDRSYVAALDALGRNEEELAAISSLRSVFPAESAADADALFYYQGCADQRMGRPGWAASLRTILFERPTSAWTARALDFVEAIEPHTRDFSAAERGVVRMRLAVAARDYGVAYHEAMAARKLVFTAKASPLVVADAGKAFLYSGQSKEGLGLFASLEESARSYADSLGDVLATARSARVAWTAAFYRARFYRALERWKEAEGLFERLAAGAGSPEDADAARWYAVDGADKVPSAASRKLVGAARDRALRRVTLDALQRAALSWYDPSLFSDLADALFREALQARDWELIYDMAG